MIKLSAKGDLVEFNEGFAVEFNWIQEEPADYLN
jgi:hypothetical protein